jgi:putative ABC transport system permease protein
MRRQIALTAAVVTIVAAGIGATTAAYAVVESVLLRSLPYPDSSRLVVFRHVTPKGEGRAFAAADFLDYAARDAHAASIAAYASWPMNLTGDGTPERLRSIIVSGDFFKVAGTPPLLGRVTTPADDSSSAPAVVVLAHGFWLRRFGGRPEAIGTPLVLNGRPATVVGVMPPEFALPGAVDLWMPMGLTSDVLANRAGEWLSLVGRLQPGVTIRAAQAEVDVTSAQLAAEFPPTNAGERAVVRTLLDETVGGVRRPLWLGAAAALFVLLAGCANAANLLLARATLRRDEMAVRAALGAEPFRLTRQLMVESGVLTAAGGVLGVGVAWLFLRAFVLLAGARVPRLAELRLDAAAVGIAAALSFATTWIFGGAAAWLLVRAKAATRSAASPRYTRSNRLGAVLLAGQVAFAIVLLAGAAAVVRGYSATLAIDPGFDTADTMTLQLTLPRSRHADDAAHVRFAERALEAIAQIPGVISAGVVSDLPFVGNATHFEITAAGESEASRLTTVRLADPGFFATLRVPLVAGRSFDAADRAGAPAVAVLNRTAADQYGGAGVLGRQLQIADRGVRTVVGIVGDIKHGGLHGSEGPVVYVPYAQKTFPFISWMGIVVRGAGTTITAASLKSAVASVDTTQPVQSVRSMQDYLADEVAPYRFSSLVVGSLATVALVLAATGIYGLTAFVVGRRTRELGVRMALGATRAHVVLLVVRQIAVALASGAAIGVAGSLAANGMLRAAIGTAATSGGGAELAVGGGIVGVAAIAAAIGPALRAARIDPTTSLRCE